MNRVLYEALEFPVLQNRVYLTQQEALSCPRGDIRIIEDEETGLVYNDAFRTNLMQYDINYNNEQANSPFFQKHLEAVKDIIYQQLGSKSLVEVGCGKGFFFELLLADGFDIFGFDPTYDGDSPRIVKEYFKPGIMRPSRGLILRHVLEHVPDPYNFLCELRDANGGNGLIYIEVPCFDWICSRLAWFDIFYEHVNYFRMTDFFEMFGSVKASGHLFGDQYLYVVADLSSLKPPVFKAQNSINFPNDFLESLTSSAQNREDPVVVWGGASKGVVFSLLHERVGNSISAVVDVNPLKQGRFLPITGLKVLSPDDLLRLYPKGTTVYVMNTNYINEIREMSLCKYNYVGVDQ